MSVGTFVWRDLMSTDPEKSKTFFTELLGWTVKPVEMGGEMGTYEMLHAGEEGVGGIVPLDASHGVPSHWISYVTAKESVDATSATADKLGGKTCVPPTDIPTVGRFSVVEDPNGAVFSPFIGEGEMPDTPAAPDANPAPGTVAWNELATDDVEAAKSFYSELFGWTTQAMPMADGMTYTVAMQDGNMVAGLMEKTPDMPRSAWTIYFEVKDTIDQALEEVQRLGGQAVSPIIDVPNTGKLFWALDPTGASFALMQSA